MFLYLDIATQWVRQPLISDKDKHSFLSNSHLAQVFWENPLVVSPTGPISTFTHTDTSALDEIPIPKFQSSQPALLHEDTANPEPCLFWEVCLMCPENSLLPCGHFQELPPIWQLLSCSTAQKQRAPVLLRPSCCTVAPSILQTDIEPSWMPSTHWGSGDNDNKAPFLSFASWSFRLVGNE